MSLGFVFCLFADMQRTFTIVLLRPTPTGPFLPSPQYYTPLAPTGPSADLVIANWDSVFFGFVFWDFFGT